MARSTPAIELPEISEPVSPSTAHALAPRTPAAVGADAVGGDDDLEDEDGSADFYAGAFEDA